MVVYIVFLCAILLWGLLYRRRGRTGFPSQTKPPKNADDKLHSNNNGNVPENSVQVLFCQIIFESQSLLAYIEYLSLVPSSIFL